MNAAEKNEPTHRRDRIGPSVTHRREALLQSGAAASFGNGVFVGGAAVSLVVE